MKAHSRKLPELVIVFGPPSVGVTTLIEVLKESSTTRMMVIPFSSGDLVALPAGSSIMSILDVEGGLLSPKDIQRLVDNGQLTAANGLLIRVHDLDKNILARAASRKGYVEQEDLNSWNVSCRQIDDVARRHSIPVYYIPNSNLENAVRNVALRIGLTD